MTGTEFCEHHTRAAAERGAEAVKRGEHLPSPRKRAVQAAVVAEEVEPITTNGSSVWVPIIRFLSELEPSSAAMMASASGPS